MTIDIDCPFCEFKFKGRVSSFGECPQCQEQYECYTVSCIDGDHINRYEDWDIVEWYRHRDLQSKYDFK